MANATNLTEQILENRVIGKLNNINVENLYDTLWSRKLISSMGSRTLDSLRNEGTISAEAQQFVEKHWENDTDLTEQYSEGLITDVSQYNIQQYAKEEFGKHITELTSEEMEEAYNEGYDNSNYYAFAGLMATEYDNVVTEMAIEANTDPNVSRFSIIAEQVRKQMAGSDNEWVSEAINFGVLEKEVAKYNQLIQKRTEMADWDTLTLDSNI